MPSPLQGTPQPELFAKSIPPSLVNRNKRARPRRTAEIDDAFPMDALPSPLSSRPERSAVEIGPWPLLSKSGLQAVIDNAAQTKEERAWTAQPHRPSRAPAFLKDTQGRLINPSPIQPRSPDGAPPDRRVLKRRAF
jgi:hypothetical protein